MTILLGTNAQWYIIKKNYPSALMNYPNPGKRSISEEEFNLLNIDCSIPYSSLNSYKEKTAWLFSCNNQRSPLTTIDDSALSLSTSDSMEDELYSIPHQQRTRRSNPPYLSEQQDLFNRKVLRRLRRSINK
jgi:hypothetical protein